MNEGPGLLRSSARWLKAAALVGPAAVCAQDGALPTGFGPLNLGMSWDEARTAGAFTELTRPTTPWERHVYECGYRSARFTVDGGNVLVTVQDHRVTELSFASPLQPGSKVMQVAGRVIEEHGQPRQATLRDGLGAVTIDQTRANHALLEYQGPVDARFSISGGPLWEYRITVTDRDTRRLENRTIRCARIQDRQTAESGGKS